MTEHIDETDAPEAVDSAEIEEVSNGYDPSALAQLVDRRRKLESAKPELELDVPGYDGEMVVKYKRLPWEYFKKQAEKMEKNKNPYKELLAQADVLINACEGIYMRDSEGKLHPIDPSGEPVVFGDRLTQLLEVEDANTARKCLFKVFNNNLAVTSQYVELTEWMEASRAEEDDEYVGE